MAVIQEVEPEQKVEDKKSDEQQQQPSSTPEAPSTAILDGREPKPEHNLDGKRDSNEHPVTTAPEATNPAVASNIALDGREPEPTKLDSGKTINTQPTATPGPVIPAVTANFASAAPESRRIKLEVRENDGGGDRNDKHPRRRRSLASRLKIPWIYKANRAVAPGLRLTGKIILIFFVTIGAIVLIALSLAVSLGSIAANGAVMLVIGNAVLKAAGHAGYVDARTAAIIGAVGSLLAIFCLAPVTSCLQSGDELPWFLQIPITILFAVLSGVIGTSLLIRTHFDVKGMDVLHGARAGAVGAAIFGPGSALVIVPILAIVLAPLWAASLFGIEWAYIKSSEQFTENSHSYSTCVCTTCCIEDPEILGELQHVQEIHERHRRFMASSHIDNW